MHDTPDVLSLWADQKSQQAVEAAELIGHRTDDPIHAARMFQACGDMCLLSGKPEDAERWYRRAMRRLTDPVDIDCFSCRAAGLQSLYFSRIESAANCFQRLSVEGNTVALRMEAMLTLAFLFHDAGMFPEAHADLHRMADLAIGANLPDWLAIVHSASDHFSMLARVHTSREMDGHVHWQAYPQAGAQGVDAQQQLPPRLPRRPRGMPLHSSMAVLLSSREDHVYRLGLLSNPDHRESDAWIRPSLVQTWGNVETAVTRPQALIEMALSALSARRSQLAALLLEPLSNGGDFIVDLPDRSGDDSDGDDEGRGHSQRQNYLYCLSRLCLQQGKLDESGKHYRQYLNEALSTLGAVSSVLRRCTERAAAASTAPEAEEDAPRQSMVDDVSVRLPARYRDAYHFMLRHMHRSNLSMQEVASGIGVTERALQLAFKRHLGESPREVLRRRRMQRIRDELLLRPQSQVRIMDVAAKYGVANRASLINGYRKYFAEAPSETVSRQPRTTSNSPAGVSSALTEMTST
ncbi:MAG: Transcriptional regulator, AraC family [Rhizobacter sp.]|nr:Transcriptional regulator, AraC family [Rhizobacter sp.]